jgi:polyisoprenoid-binding protein YceI
MKIRQILFVLLLWTTTNYVRAQTSTIISGSTDFSIRFVLGTCYGTFQGPKGEARFDEKHPEEAFFDITVAAATFNTNSNLRDKDMKSEKYFFVTKYPNIHFKSSKVERKDGNYIATGTLTIRDVAKKVILPFEAKKNNDGTYSLSSTFDLNRLDYHVGDKNWKLKEVVTVKLKAVIK